MIAAGIAIGVGIAAGALFISAGVSFFTAWALGGAQAFAQSAFGIGASNALDLPVSISYRNDFSIHNALAKGKLYAWSGAYLSMERGIPVPVIYGMHRYSGNVINVNTERGRFITYGTVVKELNGTWDGMVENINPYGKSYSYSEASAQPHDTENNTGKDRRFRYAITDTVSSVNIRIYAEGSIRVWLEQANFSFEMKSYELGIIGGPMARILGEIEMGVKCRAGQYNLIIDHKWAMNGCVSGLRRIWGEVYDVNAAPLNYNNYINVLIGQCEGEINSINRIEINGQSKENYAESSVLTDFRSGIDNQVSIPFFAGTNHNTPLDQTLDYNTPYTHTGTIINANKIKLEFYLSQGLYKLIEKQYTYWEAKIKIEIRLNPAGSWEELGNITASGSTPKPFYRYYEIDDLASDKYDVRVTKTTADPDNVETFGTIKLKQITETEYGEKIYPHTALLFCQMRASEQLSGNMPNISAVIEGKKIEVPELTYGVTTADFDEAAWDSSNGYYCIGTAVTGFNWDGSTLVTQSSNNPAWCLYDFLSSTRYGMGQIFPAASLDKQSFFDAGKYCDGLINSYTPNATAVEEKRYELDVVIEGPAKGMDIAKQMMQTFGGFLLWEEGKVHLEVDKPSSPVQLFNMGNIVKDSFVINYFDYTKNPNSLAIQFTNKENNWEKETILIEDQTLIDDYGKIPGGISFFGITRPTQIIRMGRTLLNSGKYSRTGITFKADIDSLNCEIGDVVNVQHDAPQWSDGGRIIESTATHIFLDKEIYLATGNTYQIMCRLTGDDLETKYIEPSISGYIWDLTVTGDFSKVPQAESLWAVGIQNVTTKPFRIINMARDKDDKVLISSVGYNEAVFSVSGETYSDLNYSYADPFGTIPEQVTGLNVELESDYYAAILVDWEINDEPVNYKGADVYVKTTNDDNWQWYKTVMGKLNARYSPVIVDRGYNFRVVAFNDNRDYAIFENAPSAYIYVTTTGETTGDNYLVYEPPVITGLTLS